MAEDPLCGNCEAAHHLSDHQWGDGAVKVTGWCARCDCDDFAPIMLPVAHRPAPPRVCCCLGHPHTRSRSIGAPDRCTVCGCNDLAAHPPPEEPVMTEHHEDATRVVRQALDRIVEEHVPDPAEDFAANEILKALTAAGLVIVPAERLPSSIDATTRKPVDVWWPPVDAGPVFGTHLTATFDGRPDEVRDQIDRCSSIVAVLAALSVPLDRDGFCAVCAHEYAGAGIDSHHATCPWRRAREVTS